MKIYDIDKEIADIVNPPDDQDAAPSDDEDSIPPDYRDFDPQALDDLDINIDRQLRNYIAAIKNLKFAGAALSAEIKHLQE